MDSVVATTCADNEQVCLDTVGVTTSANTAGENGGGVDTVVTSDGDGETCTPSFSETTENSKAAGEELKPHSLDTTAISTASDETGTRVCVDTAEKFPVVLVRDMASKFRHELEKIRNNESGECTKFQVESERNMETRLEELTVSF